MMLYERMQRLEKKTSTLTDISTLHTLALWQERMHRLPQAKETRARLVRMGVVFTTQAEYHRVTEPFRLPRPSYDSRHLELPRKPRKRMMILHAMLDGLEPSVRLRVDDLNRYLGRVIHELRLATDYCHLRRYMLSDRLLRREIDGSIYWVNPDCLLVIEP